jgi:hypothetical protein
MAIQFHPSDIEEFFGVSLDRVVFGDPGREQYGVDYSGDILKYSMIIDIEKDTVMISGDRQSPWCGDSMYEIGVPCTSISALPTRMSADGLDVKRLSFFYGDPTDIRHRTLTIIMRPDRELVVWPTWPYPKGHPYEHQRDGQSQNTPP